MIHPSAHVHPSARLAPDVTVGPFAIIEAETILGPGCRIAAHAVVKARVELGAGVRVDHFAVVGGDPQDLSFDPATASGTFVGERTVIREHVTIHRATQAGQRTIVGADGLLMAGSHVAHDCIVGDHVILANGSAFAGHCVVEDHVICGGLSGVHQFSRLGRFAFISGGAMVTMDIPPYCTAQGDRAALAGLNTVGLTRSGFTSEQVSRIKGAYKVLFRSGLGLREALAHVAAEFGGHPEIDHFVRFIEGSERGIAR